MARRLLLSLACLLCACGLVQCDGCFFWDPPPPPPVGCQDEDCPDQGDVCNDSDECVTLCVDDHHCDTDERCNQDLGWCVPRDLDCVTGLDCDAPKTCEFLDGARCVQLACYYVEMAEGTPCDDGDPYTENDRCDDYGNCVGEQMSFTPPDFCDDAADCGPNQVCGARGEDTSKACRSVEGETCEDNTDCAQTCIEGVCAPAAALWGGCDDDGDCADVSSVCADGACYVGLGAPCVERAECDSFICADGVCCNEACGDPCLGCEILAGTCSPLSDVPCDDGDPCTVDERCWDGTCEPDYVYECDDANPCTTDTCDGLGGCDHDERDGEPCGPCLTCDLDACTAPVTADDGPECDDPCTHCEAGVCVAYDEAAEGECPTGQLCCGGPPLACEVATGACP